MPANTFGHIFRITTFGESHGVGIGVVIDGCPAGLEVDISDIQKELDRRRPGQSNIVTQRKESDTVVIQSGVFDGKTTGTPISLYIANQDQKSKDYDHIRTKYRPSHADYTFDKKFGFRDYRGGGRSSARETAARVAAGAIAKLLLQKLGLKITAYVNQVGHLKLEKRYQELDFTEIEKNVVRTADPKMAEKMVDFIKKIRKQGDTVGGVINCVVQNCPVGLGEPVFDKLHADLGKAMLSINAVKGFEYGSGFDGVAMKGSEHNDIFTNKNDKISTETNFSGGIQGGISNGEDIYFRVAFKPVATLMQNQQSIDSEGNITEVIGKGRHDPCVVPRAVAIVEAMTALVLADHFLRNKNSTMS